MIRVKKLVAVFTLVLLLLLMTGCQKEKSDSAIRTDFHIALATDETINKYDSFHEYNNDESGARLIIWPDGRVRNFAFISVGNREVENKIYYFAKDTLFSVEELSPEKPFVVKLLIPGLVSAWGISFLDENNVQRYFAINLDGRGEDEASPYFLLEFNSDSNIQEGKI